jgi:putative endonuclease
LQPLLRFCQTYNLKKSETGKLGELLAQEYLIHQGYQILTTNFHSPYGEIDIVAEKYGKIHFVEVKTRKTLAFGLPVEAYHHMKQQKIIKTAYIYLDKQSSRRSFQFDFIGIMLKPDNQLDKLEMMENALY